MKIKLNLKEYTAYEILFSLHKHKKVYLHGVFLEESQCTDKNTYSDSRF